jgi:DNA ligase 1
VKNVIKKFIITKKIILFLNIYLKMPTKQRKNLNCNKFKKSINPKCNDQIGCNWTVGKGCLSSSIKSKPIVPPSPKPTTISRTKTPNCKKFKKSINPKCNDQIGCNWTVGKGCLSSSIPTSTTKPTTKSIPKPTTKPTTKPRTKSIPKSIPKPTTKPRTKTPNCKKFKKSVNPRCNDQDGCNWTVGKGCLSKTSVLSVFEPKVSTSELKSDTRERVKVQNKYCSNIGYNKVWNFDSVMLAHTFRDNKTNKIKKPPKGVPQAPVGWYLSEKFDGFRAIWDGKDFRSRTNKVFNAPGWFKLWMPPGIALDGELFLGRCNFESCALMNRKIPRDEEWVNVKYQIFDAPNHPGIFEERYQFLKDTIKNRCNCKNLIDIKYKINCPLRLTKQTKINSESEMDGIFKTLVKEGAEGIMLRAPNSPYETKRSSHLLKVKTLFDDECKIIGYKPGSGKYTGMLGAFHCETIKTPHKQFYLSGMPDEVRRNYKKTHKPGTIITYTYMGLTNTGKPRHPNYLRIRKGYKFDRGQNLVINDMVSYIRRLGYKERYSVVSEQKSNETYRIIIKDGIKNFGYTLHKDMVKLLGNNLMSYDFHITTMIYDNDRDQDGLSVHTHSTVRILMNSMNNTQYTLALHYGDLFNTRLKKLDLSSNYWITIESEDISLFPPSFGKESDRLRSWFPHKKSYTEMNEILTEGFGLGLDLKQDYVEERFGRISDIFIQDLLEKLKKLYLQFNTIL